MDQVKCPNCHRFYSFNGVHVCPAKGQNRGSSTSAEVERENITFPKSTSDVPNDCFRICSQATPTNKREHASFQRSSPNILFKKRKYFDTSAGNVDLVSSSQGPSNSSQCSLSGLSSDCPDETKLREENEGFGLLLIAEAMDIDVGQDHSVSSDTNTVDADNPPEVSSKAAFVCYCCSNCERIYPNRNKLLNHVGVHTGEKKFQCSECGRGFTRRHYLDSHVESYVGQDPSICKGCGKSFTFKCALESHFCSKYGNKTIPCDFCDETFSAEGSVLSHKKHQY